MSLEERQYGVLVVSSGEKFYMALKEMLPASAAAGVKLVASVSGARLLLAERAFDFVLINSPLPDSPGVRFAIDACQGRETVALLFVRAELHDETYARVVGHGVFTLAKPTSKPALAQALRWMASARERLRAMEQKSLSMEEKMAEIRLVNRAKWLLIGQKGMDEPQAHRWMEKQAMDRCLTKRQVAEELIGQLDGGYS